MIKKLLILAIGISSAYANTGKLKHGKHYLFIDSENNEIKCQVQSLCDIALIKGDSLVNWIITDGKPWSDSATKKTTYLDNDGREHVILQATSAEDNNPAILVATNNQYHFNLVSTNEKVASNNYVFDERSSNEYNSHNANVDNGIDINFNGKKVYGSYDIEGDVKSAIRPVSVFNDGKRTYIQMDNKIDVSDLPTVYTYDKGDNLQTLAGVRYRRPFFVIDGIRPRYALIVGSTNSDDMTRVDIKLKKDKQGFWGIFKTQYVE